MADKDKNKSVEAANNSADALLEKLLKEGAVELSLDRHIYAAEDCGDVPLVGFMIDLLDMPPIKAGKDKDRDWKAFVFLATHDTKGRDREGNVVTVKAGEEILIAATYQIEGSLRRFVGDPAKMHEIAIKPKTKLDLGGGQTMWQYRVIVTKKTQDRGVMYPSSYAKKNLSGTTEGYQQLSDGSLFNKATGEIVSKAVAPAS